MFAEAYAIASAYTHPVITSVRKLNGEVQSGLAAFIVLNDDGWILTAGHVGMQVQAFSEQQRLATDYEAQVVAIKEDARLNATQKQRRVGKLQRDDQWATNFSLWWGDDTAQAHDYKIDLLRDLALVQLDPFPEGLRSTYPVLLRPDTEPLCGTSLCRLGFPFYSIASSFITETNSFELAPESLPVPRFPIDGILTRFMVQKDAGSGREAKFIETSSPGLRGQSGGPIFDVHGRVWGLQSGTLTIDLDIHLDITRADLKKPTREYQCVNLGYGPCAAEILAFLAEHDVACEVSA
jgi:hypothetical protein